MWLGLLWIVVLAVAGLVYPRVRTTAALFVVLGVLSLSLALTQRNGNNLGVLAGAFWIGLGLWYLLKFRTADARAKHIGYWTEKAS